MRMKMRNKYLFNLLALIFLGYSQMLFADDPGITKVRLIQQTDTVYLFETDVPAIIMSSIRTPVFPERFKIRDFEYTDQSGWITLRWTISSSGEPLLPEEEIVLPWLRNGVDFTVQWKNGSTFKGLYNRSLNGIHIPLSELMPVQKTTQEVLQEGFMLGLKHFSFKFVHPLLILVLVLAFPSFKVVRYLLAISLGQMAAMILVELGLPGFDLLFADILFILIIFLLSYSKAYHIKFNYLTFILAFAGIIHGLSYAFEINSDDLKPLQLIQSLFAFNIATDLGYYLFAALLLLILRFIPKSTLNSKWLTIATGSISVMIVLLIFSKNKKTEQFQILEQKKTTVIKYDPATKTTELPSPKVQRGANIMNTPIMLYLSVEPFEIRQEILLQASVVNEFLHFNAEGSDIIPIAKHEQIKKDLQYAISSKDTMYVDDRLVKPTDVITNFVTLSRGGVSVRETPVEEKIDEAIFGVTLIYEVESYPDSISIDWKLFPNSVPIEASAVDPHSTYTTVLTPDENIIYWKSRLAGYQAPAIETIKVEIQPQAIFSFIIWFIVLLLVIFYWINKKKIKWRLIAVAIVLGLFVYPFLRERMNFPFMIQGKPSSEKAGVILNDLLSNVYRAFDRRNESDVYDRLSLSVTSDQLTSIYMQNRQSMALENRGGARANIDDVNIQEVYDIKRDENGGYIADTRWTVGGSVNHFGHTHYRQNQYRALVSFGIYDENWKIRNIELLDTRRLY